jgi:hypothetical protein
MPMSQVRVRHVFVLTADRRTDLVGRPLLHVHPTISMTHMNLIQKILPTFHLQAALVYNIICNQ